jgi:TrmH family RNA methyltransferase
MPVLRESLRVVLLSPRNPLNIGAVARAMSNFGFEHLRIVSPYEIAYQEARSAVNASAVLAKSEQYHTLSEAIRDCTLVVGTASPGHRTFELPFRRLETGGRMITDAVHAGGHVALLFGCEKFGMSNQEIAHCHWLMHIPTRPEHDSMNLGQAVAVCLYELVRETGEAARVPLAREPARNEDVQRIASRLIEIAGAAGYANPVTSESTEQKIRHMVNRLNLNDKDAAMWLGLLRQIVWKIGRGSE